MNGAASLRTVRLKTPLATEMLFGLSTKHSGPEWKPLSAVVIGSQSWRFSVVPLNSSSSEHCQEPPVAFGSGLHELFVPVGIVVVLMVRVLRSVGEASLGLTASHRVAMLTARMTSRRALRERVIPLRSAPAGQS